MTSDADGFRVTVDELEKARTAKTKSVSYTHLDVYKRQINDVPVVIDFRTDSSEKVFPMVAAGASNDDIQVHPLQRGGAK